MPRMKKPNGQIKATEDTSPTERLSSATENYLLCLYRLWEDSEAPTITQLTDTLKQLPPTEGLGTSVPSVAGMIRRMEKQGMVEVGQDKKIRLSRKGLQAGEDIARRHRLAEWLVVKLLGMELHHAHIEAHRLEHGMSRELEEKLMERLDHPQKSPFGRPIPGTGQPKTPANRLTLETAESSVTYIVDQIPEEDPALLRFLANSLIIPDHEVKILEAAPYRGVLVVSTQAGTVSIGYRVAQHILVRPPEGP